MEKRTARILLFTTLGFFVVGAGIVGYAFRQFSGRVSGDLNAATRIVEIEAGDGVNQISLKLKDAGVIRSAYFFEVYAWIEGIGSSLKAGTYAVSPHKSTSEIARMLAAGETSPNERVIRIVEGWSNREIATYLADKGVADRDAFLVAASATDSRRVLPDRTFAFLADKPAVATLEGYLFPDTYRIFQDATVEDLIGKMLDGFGTRVDAALLDAIRAKGKTVHEAVTVASLLEKEVRTEEDRRMVADLIGRRIAAGIPLQLDSTVNYLTGKNDPTPSLDDLAVESPYNTYKVSGLPPGPIGNPSIASIRAALDPLPNDYFYYLTAPGGKTIFSKTLEEHNANKAKHLK